MITLPSLGMCSTSVLQPLLPTNGNPPRPDNGIISPHLLKNSNDKSSSGSSWFISSGHELFAKRVLCRVKPLS